MKQVININHHPVCQMNKEDFFEHLKDTVFQRINVKTKTGKVVINSRNQVRMKIFNLSKKLGEQPFNANDFEIK